MDFYDGTKLLSLKDKNGNPPEIIICTSNRSAGKTTYFSRYCVNRFIKYKEKFCVLYRYKNELDDCANKFFKDIQSLFFTEYNMTDKSLCGGSIKALFIQKNNVTVDCGYAIAINTADTIKKYSHYLSDVTRIIFDEFQSETNNYCHNEIEKFMSVHTSISRGQGKQTRFVPVIMLSNPVTILNPYYAALGISDLLKNDTKFLRGNGYVLEQGYNESASIAIKNSSFAGAFENVSYSAYNSEGIYLRDELSFIEKLSGEYKYICNLLFNGKIYAVKEFGNLGIVYVDKKVDKTAKINLAVNAADMSINYVMLKEYSFLIDTMRYYFNHGAFRFADLECKQIILKILSY